MNESLVSMIAAGSLRFYPMECRDGEHYRGRIVVAGDVEG